MAVKIQVDRWKRKDGSIAESWRLVIVDCTGAKQKPICPPKEEYSRYGMNAADPLSEAREKLKSLQAKNKLERLAERKAKIGKRLEKESLKESAYLPHDLYERFREWLMDRRMWDRIPDKTEVHLRKMRQIILDVNMDPSEMADRPEKVYRWFRTKELSLSYMDKILPLLNAYGYFYCRELKKPWINIPTPTGDLARRIQDVNLTARNGRRGPSLIMQEKDFPRLGDLKPPQILWMEYSFYFGLRPGEVDQLKPSNEGRFWRLRRSGPMIILEIYQPKLIKVEPIRRWKRIPCLLKRQRQLAEILESGKRSIQRPLTKSIQARLGEGYTLYTGRKSFAKFMRSRGQERVHISKWLGHQQIQTTDRHYDDYEAVDFTPIQN